MSEQQQVIPRKSIFYSNLFILSLFIALYIGLIVKYCWGLPFPSDPTLYIGPVVWKSFVGHFHTFDRIMIPLGVYFVSWAIPKVHVAGMVYVGIVNVLIFLCGIIFCYRRGGMISAVFLSIFLGSSYFLTSYATYIYPVQTEALYSVLAFICFFSRRRKWFHPVFYAGLLSAFAVFSKITACATVLYFGVYLIVDKRPRELVSFVMGAAAGVVAILGLTCLIFGFESLIYIFTSFGRHVGGAMTVRGEHTNLVSYVELFFDHVTLPVFLSLFILTGAYRLTHARNSFWMALSHIGLLSLLYTFSTRGGPVNDNYVYTAFIFTSIGLALYMGSLFENGTFKRKFWESFMTKNLFRTVLSTLFLCLLIAGLTVGIKYKPTGIFLPTWILNFPTPVRWFYTLGPILTLGLLVFVEFSKLKSAVIVFMTFVTFWSASYCAGLGITKAEHYRRNAQFFYDAAELIQEVPVKNFSLYIAGWSRFSDKLPVPRVLRVYRLFFDGNKENVFQSRHTAHQESKKILEDRIEFISKRKNISSVKWPYLVTDDVGAVKRYYPRAILVKKLPYYDSYAFVFDIRR